MNIISNIYCNLRSRIYKVTVRATMKCTAETPPDKAKTKQLLETNEMRVLRKIARQRS